MNRNGKIAYCTWIYKLREQFLDDYIITMNSQTYRNLDIFFIDNGMSPIGIDKLRDSLKYDYIKILNYNNESIINKILNSIRYLISEGYNYLIFGDIDDVFSIDRFEKYAKYMNNNYDIFYNELWNFDKESDFFSKKMPSEINGISNLIKCNFLGMSITGINLRRIKKYFELELFIDDVVAFDWYFYSLILLYGGKAKKIDSVKTYYRIYDENLAGETSLLTYKKLITGLNVKLAHYKALSKHNDIYVEELLKINQLKLYLMSDSKNIDNYLGIVNTKFSQDNFWWEKIKSIEEVGGCLND